MREMSNRITDTKKIIKELEKRIKELTKICNDTNNRLLEFELYGMIQAYKECVELLKE